MQKIINIAIIRDKNIKARKLEFEIDKDYIELEAKDYDRAKYNRLLKKEKDIQR